MNENDKSNENPPFQGKSSILFDICVPLGRRSEPVIKYNTIDDYGPYVRLWPTFDDLVEFVTLSKNE